MIVHFWKGLSSPESQISAVPPDRYGDRFVRFINGVTKTREAAELEKAEERAGAMFSPELIDDPRLSGVNMYPLSAQSQTSPKNQEATDKVMRKAEKQAEKSKRHGAHESSVPTKTLSSARSPSPPGDPTGVGYTLPVVEEDVEGQSVGGRSARSRQPSPSLQPEGAANADVLMPANIGLPVDMRGASGGGETELKPPPTPPKERLSVPAAVVESRRSSHRPHTPQSQTPSIRQVDGAEDANGDLPPTPPKDSSIGRGRSPNRDKALPKPPIVDDEESMIAEVLRPLDAT